MTNLNLEHPLFTTLVTNFTVPDLELGISKLKELIASEQDKNSALTSRLLELEKEKSERQKNIDLATANKLRVDLKL